MRAWPGKDSIPLRDSKRLLRGRVTPAAPKWQRVARLSVSSTCAGPSGHGVPPFPRKGRDERGQEPERTARTLGEPER